MCEENGVGECQVMERQRKRMCKRWSVQEGRISVGERSGHSHSNGQKCNMIIRMFAVKRGTFPSDKLFITGFINKGHFKSDYKVADL